MKFFAILKEGRIERAKVYRARLALEALEDRFLPSLAEFTSFTLNGDYVAAGVGLRGRTSGDIMIADIPDGSTIAAAYLYYGYLDNESPGLAAITFAGTPFTGTLVGTNEDTCWFRANSQAYRADVSSVVTGNGAYAVTDVASGGAVLAEGASLVVVYQDGAQDPRTIVLYDGDDVVNGHFAIVSNTFGGFQVNDPASAKTTFIVGDGQVENPKQVRFTGSGGTLNLDNTINGSDGAFWDTTTADVSAQLAAGDTAASALMGQPPAGGNYDCLMWVGQVLSLNGVPANRPPRAEPTGRTGASAKSAPVTALVAANALNRGGDLITGSIDQFAPAARDQGVDQNLLSQEFTDGGGAPGPLAHTALPARPEPGASHHLAPRKLDPALAAQRTSDSLQDSVDVLFRAQE